MIPKFRCWDEPNKIMRSNDETVMWNGQVYINEKKELDSKIKGFSCLPEHLMQSTGLKDKNEVEIFEGDIVQCTVDNWSNGEKFEQIDKVVYEDCMFTFSDGYKYDCSIAEPTYLSKEVIGNIYENPDLLEAE